MDPRVEEKAEAKRLPTPTLAAAKMMESIICCSSASCWSMRSLSAGARRTVYNYTSHNTESRIFISLHIQCQSSKEVETNNYAPSVTESHTNAIGSYTFLFSLYPIFSIDLSFRWWNNFQTSRTHSILEHQLVTLATNLERVRIELLVSCYFNGRGGIYPNPKPIPLQFL